jgi:hypothetical protein
MKLNEIVGTKKLFLSFKTRRNHDTGLHFTVIKSNPCGQLKESNSSGSLLDWHPWKKATSMNLFLPAMKLTRCLKQNLDSRVRFFPIIIHKQSEPVSFVDTIQ